MTSKDDEDTLLRSAVLQNASSILIARQRAEQRQEAYLAEAQRLSHTGAFGWKVSTGEIVWSEEIFQIFQYERSTVPTVERVLQRVHPEDAALVRETTERALQDGKDFEHEYRLVMPDGFVKHVHVVAHASSDALGELEFVGAIMDVTEHKRNETELLHKTALLDELFEGGPDAVALSDLDRRVLRTNREFRAMFGYTAEEAAGRVIYDLIVPEDELERARALAALSMSGGGRAAVECERRRKDGSRIHVSRKVAAIVLGGKPVGFLSIYRDISERKRAEMLLAAEKRLLEMIATGDSRASILDALCRLVEELASGSLSSILLLDPNASRLRHGAAPSLPIAYTEAIDGAVIGPSAGSCGTAAYRGEPVMVSDIATDPLWADYRDLALAHGLRACWSTPILSSHGKVLGTFAIYYREPRSPAAQEHSFMEQITHLASIAVEREQAEEELREQANLLDLTHDTVFVRDMNDVITYWNRGAEERYGWTRQEAVGKVSHQLTQTVFPIPLEEINAELLRGDRWEGELIHTRRDGTPVVVASRWALQRDQARRPAAILETNNDITERKRWRSLTEALPQLVWAATPDGACDYFSTQWTEYTGVPEADLLGWRWMEVLHLDDRENTRKFWADSVAGRRPYDVEYRVRRHDGAYGWFKTRGTPIRDSDGRIIKWFGTCTDITESETRYRNIFQTVGVSIWEEDFSQVKGAIDALKNRGIQDFRQYLCANPQFVQQAISTVRIVDVNDATLKLFAAESKAELLASLHKVFLPETQEVFVGELIAIAEGRTSFEAETILQTLKGKRLTVLFTMTFPPSSAGFESVLVSVTDITERKAAEAERERLGQRLRQAEKMEAVGKLAGGIAHDFNNVLGGILAYGEMLFDEAPTDSPLKRYAQNVLTAATRGRALVEQILAYSRSQRGKRAPIDICRTVAETLELVRGSLPANIRLDASASELPLVVIGDATQLHQVVMNLCSNAIQAMSAGGTLRVALEAADLSAERALSHGALRPGRYVRLNVEDNGTGMDETTLSRIFEPFFTTKEIGRGTGLGLSLVYAIVTDLAGAIDVKSVLTQGSTFAIYLPLAEIAVAAASEVENPLPRGHGERVLLVDDEEPLVAVTAEVLARLGYEPMCFSDSQAALAAFEAAPGRFDVVVTDDLMPGLTGTGLASVVRRRRPDLPIVLVSGYSGPILTQQALAAGVSELLTKPLQSREIATTLARVLHHATS